MKPDSFPQEILRRVMDLERKMRALIGNSPLFDVANETTVQLVGNQDNFDPGSYDVLRLDASSAIDITGLAGGKKGRFLELINVGSFTITLQHQSASSFAIYRILTSTGAAVAIAANDRKRLYYDSTTERWRV